MPGLDRTGPQGRGPMTGGSRGNCVTVNQNVGFAGGKTYGRNFRGGYGRGMGMRQRYAGNFGTSADELTNLKNEVELLNRRIAELENGL